MVLNADQTKTMIFHRAPSYLPGAKFTINDSQLTSSLHEESDVNGIFQSFNRSAGAFIRKFDTLELELKNRLFDSLCLSMYGLEVVAYHFAFKTLGDSEIF